MSESSQELAFKVKVWELIEFLAPTDFGCICNGERHCAKHAQGQKVVDLHMASASKDKALAVVEAKIKELTSLRGDDTIDLDFRRRAGDNWEAENPQETGEHFMADLVVDYVDEHLTELQAERKKLLGDVEAPITPVQCDAPGCNRPSVSTSIGACQEHLEEFKGWLADQQKEKHEPRD